MTSLHFFQTFGKDLFKIAKNATIPEHLWQSMSNCTQRKYTVNSYSTWVTSPKFGIKFFLLVNVDKPYVCNGFPYLGLDDTRPSGMPMAHHVVIRLIEPYRNGGHNITFDNFFTSPKLAMDCLSKDITVIGTVRSNRRELPINIAQLSRSTELHST